MQTNTSRYVIVLKNTAEFDTANSWSKIGSSHDTLAFWGNPRYHGFTFLRGLNTGTQLLCVISPDSQPAALKGITALLLG